MKKALLLTVAATMLTSGVAMAAEPVQLDGSLKAEYRHNTADGEEHKTGVRYTFKLNALSKLDDHFDLYARLAAQAVNHRYDIGTDYNADKRIEGGVDLYGFIYKNADVSYKIGRQTVTIGETALLYNNDGYIGQNKFADGVTAVAKSGVTDIKVLAVQEDNYSNGNDNKLYAVQASYKPAEDWKVGAVLARYNREDAAQKDTTHWAVNAGYTFGKAGLVGEVTKSNADANDVAHVVGVNYAFDSKNSAYVHSFRVEQNGDIGGMTDYDPAAKGMYYGFSHKINDATTASLFYKDIESLVNGHQSDSFRVGLTYTF